MPPGGPPFQPHGTSPGQPQPGPETPPPGDGPPAAYPPGTTPTSPFSDPPAGHPGYETSVILDIGAADTKKVIIGAVVSGVIGLVAVVAGLAGAVDGGTGTAIAVTVIGLLFLIPAVLTIAMRRKLFRPRRLILEPAGLRWDDPHGAPWAVAWRELAAVSVSKHTPVKVTHTVGKRLAGAAADKMIGERGHLRLDLHPADLGFAPRHPEMDHLRDNNGYRLPLGGNMQFIPLIAGAMGRFAPQIYRGVTMSLS